MTISFKLPEDASREDALLYAVDAVQSMKGCLRPAGGYDDNDPGDPMFYLDANSVVVTTTVNGRLVHTDDIEETTK